MITYRTATLGCKVNQYETRQIEELLRRAGLDPAADHGPADLVLVNTCVVTAEAARQCRQTIRRLRRDNPAAQLIVTGCYASGPDRDQLDAVDGITLVLADKDDLRQRLARQFHAPPGAARRGISQFAGRTRAFVKIQDGCDQFCAYCIVPHARPHLRSSPPDGVLDEVQRLADAGHREVVLCGIHLGRYGNDFGQTDALPGLVAHLLDLPELGRLRLSSIEAPEISDRLLDLMAAHRPRLCPHLHLPLQSGDDAVLAAMRRPYTAEQFLRTVDAARRKVPDLALTTDLMVGFPGESDDAFQRSCDLLRRAEVSRLHVFPYSPRPATPAAAMPHQVAPDVKRRRADRARRLGHELAARFAADLVGRDVTVLVERVGGNAGGSASAEGLDEHYVRTRVALGADATVSRGDLLRARATDADEATLLAQP